VSFPAPDIWHAHAEHKSKFFGWLVLHNRVLTADNMLKKNWSCDQICSFCECFQETTNHLLCECNFSEAVWDLVAYSFSLPDFDVMQDAQGTVKWFQKILQIGEANEKRRRTVILIIVWLSWFVTMI
jgi:hypothetical protein